MKSQTIQNFFSPDAQPIAFFCAEYAITSDESMYSGGLGVLAADFLFEAGDQKMPLIAFGLKYAKTKTVENGFELLVGFDSTPIMVEVPIGEKQENGGFKKILLQAWVKPFGDKTFLLLLDTDFLGNNIEDRVLGDLYDQDLSTRLKQEIYLGVGGVKLLKALNIEPRKYHLHEGNAALAALAVLCETCAKSNKSREGLLEVVRAKVVSTKHTILSIGTKISASQLWKLIGAYCEECGISEEFLMSLGAYKGDQTIFAATRLLINLSGKSNGVSVLHTVFEKKKYLESQLLAVTNGVYVPRWQSPRWTENGSVADLSPKKIWEIKNGLRKDLVEEVRKLSGVELDPNVCTLVWSRRFVEYKRPLALFTDMARLKNIISNSSKPLQIIISGRMAGTDVESIRLMEKVRQVALDPIFDGKIAFVPNDTLTTMQKFVAGGDIWLNTPIRGYEACGTSGMKAGLNGALMVSVSDGWMDEANWDGIGWVLPDGSEQTLSATFYNVLEQQILPEFYDHDEEGIPQSWVNRMRATMGLVAKDFSATKMIETYKERLYK